MPDHPWVDSADGAAVRIAMTVAAPGAGEGRLCSVTAEREGKGEGLEVEVAERSGRIHADLVIGANVAAAQALLANGDLSNRGFCLFGAGFIVKPEDAAQLEADAPIKHYRNGRDLTERPRGVSVIDLFGHDTDAVRRRWPATYQWVLERVKPERDHNKREVRKRNWWLFGEPNPKLRQQMAGLPRYIATVETAKHRTFQFLDAAIAPDNMLVCIALDDAYWLGVLSSRVHVVWALAQGGTLEDRPRYNKSRCFETFPFPVATPEQQARIRDLAEQIDAHRKRVLAAHDDLTLTGLYNVLVKVGAGDTALTAKEKAIHEKGLVAVLKQLHDELDAAVLDAYGWSDLIAGSSALRPFDKLTAQGERSSGRTDISVRGEPVEPRLIEQTILERLVALNTQRRAEEAQGHIRWLRPDFQAPQSAQAAIGLESGGSWRRQAAHSFAPRLPTPAHAPTQPATQQQWPQSLPDQLAAVARLLAESGTAQTEAQLAANFAGRGRWKSRLPDILAALEALGRARATTSGWVAG